MKRICPICEAGCGLLIRADGREVVGIEANQADVFSGGHICAKGIALKELDADPDRLRTPLVRKNGLLRPASWDEAMTVIAERLTRIRGEHGASAVGAYIGNPTAHNIGLSMGMGVFLGTLNSPNLFSAGTVDQMPKHLASILMFGNPMAIPVPDIERSNFILMLGANPAVSNGSLWMVPGFRAKLRDFHDRGGKLVCVDPRRTETARLADRHLYLRPGTDAYLLAALINELIDRGYEPPDGVSHRNWAELKAALGGIGQDSAAEHCGLSEANLHQLADDLLRAEKPVVYGRVGTTLQRHGTLTSFLIEVLNVLLGALDAPGGAMFPEQPFAAAAASVSGMEYGRWQSRVSGYPEVMGQLPCAALAEEIEVPGDGQIRALFCFAGNPVVSNPDSDRLSKALQSLDLLVCTDIYHNETTRLADVVLPGTSPFEDSHYDSFLGAMGWRNSARYSPPLFDAEDQPREWDLCLGLAYVSATGQAPSPKTLRDLEDTVVAGAVARYTDDESGPLYGRDVQEIVGSIGPEAGVERLLDLGIRAGRWGDHFGRRDGVTLQQMSETQDGIDLGELRAGRLSEVVQREDGDIDLAPPPIVAALASLAVEAPVRGLQLIGRRQAARNNSWLGNLSMLSKGQNLCVLQLHPEDAASLDIVEGDCVRVSSETGSIEAEATITDELMKGCVSLPHGFSEGTDLGQQVRRPGANYNRLAAAGEVDPLSATSALNGIVVTLAKVEPTENADTDFTS
jgi:anaerobic selenocysteine-containing dehydrogenase